MCFDECDRILVPAGVYDAQATQIQPQRNGLEPLQVLLTIRTGDLGQKRRVLVGICRWHVSV